MLHPNVRLIDLRRPRPSLTYADWVVYIVLGILSAAFWGPIFLWLCRYGGV